jgi:pimeloyl-ACP methyl ester carboxylesterase
VGQFGGFGDDVVEQRPEVRSHLADANSRCGMIGRVPVITRDDVSLWWAESDPADGAPLLLIQGLGYTADMWFRVLPGLSANRHTVRFDNRGVGRSNVPPTPWSIAEMADDAVAVLDAAGVARVNVFGVSMGGLIAQEVALRSPDRVERLVLGCTHPGGRDAVRMDPAAAMMLMVRTPGTAREAAEASVPFLYAEDTNRDDIAIDIDVRVRYPMRASAYFGQLDAMRRHEGTLARLPMLTAPTLVIHGREDRLVKPGNAELIAAAIPQARLAWIEGASHVFWTDRPAQTVSLVTEFLAEP